MKMKLNIVGLVLIILVVGFFVLGALGPDVCVIPGGQLPKKYLKIIRDLELIEDTEKIQMFYSDAFFDIKKGMYFVTEEKIVLYSTEWDKEKNIIFFTNITEVNSDLDGSSWDDSIIWITTKDGEEFKIPVANEGGGDKRFYEYLKNKCQVEGKNQGA